MMRTITLLPKRECIYLDSSDNNRKKLVYVGSFVDDIVIGGLNISQIARRVLEIDELWMFDGGMVKGSR